MAEPSRSCLDLPATPRLEAGTSLSCFPPVVIAERGVGRDDEFVFSDCGVLEALRGLKQLRKHLSLLQVGKLFEVLDQLLSFCRHGRRLARHRFASKLETHVLLLRRLAPAVT